MDDNTVLGGLLDLGHTDSALIAVRLVELNELLEGELASDIGVQDEEWLVVLGKDLLGELEGAGSSERFGLEGEVDLNTELLFVLYMKERQEMSAGMDRMYEGLEFHYETLFETNLLQNTLHDLWPVVHGKDDISDTNSCQSLDLVHDHGLVRELHKGLGHSQGLHIVVSVFLLIDRGS